MALLATVIADYTLCCTKRHWCWPLITQVVILGHLLPRDGTRIATTWLLSSGTNIVPELRWGRVNPVIHLVTPTLPTSVTILLVIPPWLWWWLLIVMGERLVSAFGHLNQTLKCVGQVHQHLCLHDRFKTVKIHMHGITIVQPVSSKLTLQMPK